MNGQKAGSMEPESQKARVEEAETVISVKNLTKRYSLYNSKKDRLLETLKLSRKKRHEDFMAVNDVTFEVKAGEFIGIIGKNGSGKSTLLKMLTGVLTPTSGSYEIKGRVSSLLELGAGFNPEYTGRENIYLNGMIMGYTREEMDEKIPSIIQFADIGSFIEQPVKMYSSGMYVRLAFAVAINVEPDILIVDEALAVGDLNFQIKCMDKFDEFCEAGITILFVSHDINSIKKFCNRTIWLRNGVMEMQGATAEVTDAYSDYLKMEMIELRNAEEQTQREDSGAAEGALDEERKNSSEKTKNVAGVCDIQRVVLLDENLNEVNQIKFGDRVFARLDFIMRNKDIKEISVGIAIHSIDKKYICGLNTMIDKFPVQYKIGENSVYLEYKNFTLLGGTYCFDTAVFEKNAYVPLEYKSRITKFTVTADYVGEGICILDHKWRSEDEVHKTK